MQSSGYINAPARPLSCYYLGLVSLVVLSASGRAGAEPALTPVPFQQVKIHDAFWSPKIRTIQKVTVEANLRQCEVTNRIRNFAVAGKLVEAKHEGMLYNDSDVYKVIEGIAYVLANERDPALEARTDEIIAKIAAAQQPDGYLNTYYTLVEPKKKWQNIAHGHELYCAGHLFEAAVAYFQATGKRQLLDVAIRLADHICDTFGPGKRIDTCGHQEIELALVKLYRATSNKKYLDQAKFFLDVRGTTDGRKSFGEYAQDHRPIRQQNEVTGHAVRAMYLYCGMADVAALTGDRTLVEPLKKIWHDVVERKMYVTGGIGPSAHNEGFTVPYDLPNDTAYAETCAALGMALWNHRMFLMTGEGKYADVLEREAYNGLLSGISLTGDRFFYTNPLGSKGAHQRVPWFDCSCCPTNVVRYVPGMGERLYAVRDNAIYTILYAGNEAEITLKEGKVRLKQQTEYPWKEDVVITVEPEKPMTFDVYLRIPGWAKNNYHVKAKARMAEQVENGNLKLTAEWQPGDEIRLSLPMPVQRVHSDPNVKTNAGRVALMRGPVVFCLEGADNNGNARNVVVPKDAKIGGGLDKNLLGGVVTLLGQGQIVSEDDGKRTTKPFTFQAIPYYAWANREPGPMVVWLPESADLAELPSKGIYSNGVEITASHCWQNDTPAACLDGKLPQSSDDHSIPRLTWWDRRGSTEWVAYRFPEARKVSSVRVYWFDDTGRGLCRIPKSWRLLYRDGEEWKPVKLAEKAQYGTAKDQLNEVAIEPVSTKELKLEVVLQENYSGGVLEWIVK